MTHSRLTNEDELIDYLANLDSGRWKRLATEVSWLRRKTIPGVDDVPVELRTVAEFVLDPDTWKRVKQRVARLRRALYRARVKAKAESAILRRRAYMREYMSRYRRKQ